LQKLVNFSFAFCHIKCGHRVHYGKVVTVQRPLLAGSIVSAACFSIVVVHIEKNLTQKLVNSKFYYCCLQIKQLRANKAIFTFFVFIFV